MNTLFLDIETNRVKDPDKLWGYGYANNHERVTWFGSSKGVGPKGVPPALYSKVSDADLIVMHKGIDFDAKQIKRLLGIDIPEGKIFDTLVAARCLWPGQSNSLDAIAKRAGLPTKTEVVDKEDFFSEYSEELADYCKQDVEVLRHVYIYIVKELKKKNLLELNKLEQEFQKLLSFKRTPAHIDFHKMQGLDVCIKDDMRQLEDLNARPDKLGPEEHKEYRYNKDGSLNATQQKTMLSPNFKITLKDGGFIKQEFVPFNMGSTTQQREIFQRESDWKPVDFTKSGLPRISEINYETISEDKRGNLGDFIKYNVLEGRRKMLQPILKNIRSDNTLFGNVNGIGAPSLRSSHSEPNTAAVCGKFHSKEEPLGDAVRGLYDTNIRSCFRAPEGFVMVGFDVGSIQAAALAHLTGCEKLREAVVSGELHDVNAKTLGVSRPKAKRWFYTWLMNGGDALLAKQLGVTVREAREIKRKFNAYYDLKEVTRWEEIVTRKGYFETLNGWQLPCVNSHYFKPYYLQSVEALIMKQTMIDFYDSDYAMRINYVPVLYNHDDWQGYAIKGTCADNFKLQITEIGNEAAKKHGFSIPLEFDVKIGDNWAETH